MRQGKRQVRIAFMTRGFLVLPILLAIAHVSHADEMRGVSGRIVDESRRPIANADVGYYWGANGAQTDKNGPPYASEAERVLWGNLGRMDLKPDTGRARTGADGRFLLRMPEECHAVMAMDQSRSRGGLLILPKGNPTRDVEIRIGPLVRVKGKLEGPGAGRRPLFTGLLAKVPYDPARPLDQRVLVHCGSFEARFEMSLPPGRYTLHAYSDGRREKDKIRGETIPDPEILLTPKDRDVDLGLLPLSVKMPSAMDQVMRTATAEFRGDYTKHYGEKAPQWNAVDARGVSKDVQLADFKGKWVLVDFWHLGCNGCLMHGLPKLARFYEQHQAQRSQFEIISICLDEDGQLKSIADLDKKLQPIVKHVWGKPLPFPILLDPTFKSWERFGRPGLGTVLLIDPEGNLVKGDETLLAEKLKHR
jgi:hypothetical protein